MYYVWIRINQESQGAWITDWRDTGKQLFSMTEMTQISGRFKLCWFEFVDVMWLFAPLSLLSGKFLLGIVCPRGSLHRMLMILKTLSRRVAGFLLVKRSPDTQLYARNFRSTMVVSFLMVLFIISFLGSLYPIEKPMSNNSSCLLRQRRCLLTGLSMSQKLPTPSTSGLYARRLRPSVGRSPATAGSGGSSNIGPRFSLDPKHAQAFNHPVVGKHFDLLLEIIQKHEIPVENIYNMDEKGCQQGGGWKESGRKYFVFCSWCPWYRQCTQGQI